MFRLLIFILLITIPIHIFANDEETLNNNINNTESEEEQEFIFSIYGSISCSFSAEAASVMIYQLRFEYHINGFLSVDICPQNTYDMNNFLITSSTHFYPGKFGYVFSPNISIGIGTAKVYNHFRGGLNIGIELLHWVSKNGFNVNIFPIRYPIISFYNNYDNNYVDKDMFLRLNINFYEIGFSF